VPLLDELDTGDILNDLLQGFDRRRDLAAHGIAWWDGECLCVTAALVALI
jgi:hypothetical protein